MAATRFKNSGKEMLLDPKPFGSHASPISSASCSCCHDDCSADDSSSLGYGSGHSSTYSDSVEARIDDFYRNSHSATPTAGRGELDDDAEFYDLDSVDNFSLGSYDYEETGNSRLVRSSCCSLPELPDQGHSHRSDAFSDFDLVEPSELLRRSFSGKLQLSDGSSPRTCCSQIHGRPVREKTVPRDASGPGVNPALGSIPEEHIYEEVHYDSTDLNLEGVRPPPLPQRTYCQVQLAKRKVLPTHRNVSCREIRKLKS